MELESANSKASAMSFLNRPFAAPDFRLGTCLDPKPSDYARPWPLNIYLFE